MEGAGGVGAVNEMLMQVLSVCCTRITSRITHSGACVCGERKCSCADVWQSPRLFIWCDRFVPLRAWFACRGAGCLLFFCAQSHTKRGIELFPQIPDGEPAAFTRLRARGGLLVSATREILPLGGDNGGGGSGSGSGGMVVSNVTVTDARRGTVLRIMSVGSFAHR